MENGIPQADSRMIPEGAIKKTWGWQKQVYADNEREVWLCFGEQGKTSWHYHKHHDQWVINLSGIQALVSRGIVETGMLKDYSNELVISEDQHSLHFLKPGLFIEVYERVDKGEVNTPAAVDDIVRE